VFKNTASQQWIVFAFQDEGGANPGEPIAGDAAQITANVRIDAGAANAVDDLNPTELEDGYYSFGITAAESNGDSIVITPVSSTANVNVIGVPGAVYTRTDVSGVEAKIDIIDTNVDDIQTRLPAALISGRMDSDVEAINDSTVAAIQLALSAAEIEDGTFEGTPSTTTLQTDLAETQDDIYIGRVIIITSGNARGEATDITDYTGASGTLEVTALANAPAATDTFILI